VQLRLLAVHLLILLVFLYVCMFVVCGGVAFGIVHV